MTNPTVVRATGCVTAIVNIPVGSVRLEAVLELPAKPCGAILLNYGRSERRLSPRRHHLGEALVGSGFATLLVELLTQDEDLFVLSRGDDPLSADRLLAAARWLAADPRTADLDIGCIGSGTGVPPTLVAAANPASRISAVVTHWGHPDLAGPALESLRVPTLMILGGGDAEDVAKARGVLPRLSCENQLFVIPGAEHSKPGPGALEELARLSARWMATHLGVNHGHPHRG